MCTEFLLRTPDDVQLLKRLWIERQTHTSTNAHCITPAHKIKTWMHYAHARSMSTSRIYPCIDRIQKWVVGTLSIYTCTVWRLCTCYTISDKTVQFNSVRLIGWLFQVAPNTRTISSGCSTPTPWMTFLWMAAAAAVSRLFGTKN